MLRLLTGVSELHAAVGSGDLRRVQLLTQKGGDVDIKNKEGSTPLHVASRSGFTTIVGELLDRHASANIPNNARGAGSTAVHEACTAGRQDSVRLLLGHRNKRDSPAVKLALVNSRDQAGRTPLTLALDGRHADLAMELIRSFGADPNLLDGSGCTPMMAAARRGDVATLASLQAAGALLDGPRLAPEGWTPLHASAAAGHEAAALYLANMGASLATRDNSARTPLDVAQANGHFVLLRQLRAIAVARGEAAPVTASEAQAAAAGASAGAGVKLPGSGTAKSKLQLLAETEDVYQEGGSKPPAAAAAAPAAASLGPQSAASASGSQAASEPPRPSLSEAWQEQQRKQALQPKPVSASYPQLEGAPVYW